MYYVIYDDNREEEFATSIKPMLDSIECEFIKVTGSEDIDSIPQDKKVITWVGDDQLYQVLTLAAKLNWQLGLLPHPDMHRFYKNFPVPKDASLALEDILKCDSPQPVDLMICNGKPVLSSVMLGDTAIMRPIAKADENIFSKIYNLIVVAFKIRDAAMQQFTLTTAKEVTLKTVALGIAMVYRPAASEFTRRVIGETEKDEASLHAVILAPRSMTQVFNYLLTRVLPERQINRDIPNYAGSIKSNRILIKGHQQLEYIQDGETLKGDEIDISVSSDALSLLTSYMPEKNREVQEKESIRSSKLPKGQAINELYGRALPWIYHVDQDEVKDTFIALKENAKLSESFVVLMTLSVLLASLGLFTNSAPVIIGAMILAPLMSPIISLSMGLLRQNSELFLDSFYTLTMGIFLVLLVGIIVTLFTPLTNINSEISARLSPTLLDLGVAIVSGIAGAYASARSEVAKSLAGVAIAVALVPPLVVSAIGIGWWEWPVFWGAFLLFLTNLVGMVLAATMTFLVLGFSPFKLAKKGLLIIMPFVILVSIPLVFAFNSMVKEQQIIQQLEGWQYGNVVIREVDIRSHDPLLISAKLQVQEQLNGQQLDKLKLRIESYIDEPVSLEVTQAMMR